jgi:hypothetical protein
MSPLVDIDEDIFQLLKRNAEPLVDTPSSVLRRMLGLGDEGGTPSIDRPEMPRQTSASSSRGSRRRASRKPSGRAVPGSLLPEAEYELPILEYLSEQGGRAPSREVIDGLEEKLRGKLTETDHEALKSGEIRWKSRAAFVRLRLIERGYLDGQAPRGTWQITEQGQARVAAAAQ